MVTITSISPGDEKEARCARPSEQEPLPVGRRTVTLELLRKRSEHNEGLVSDLEEVALHQEELESIGPFLGRTCGKTLRILLLQSNVIDRMDPSELRPFRSLEYLNLALNNIAAVEGVGHMEFLAKLDLTLNFIDVDRLEESVDALEGCRSLTELFLIGNPCAGAGTSECSSAASVASYSSSEEACRSAAESGGSDSSPHCVSGWSGCRAYIVARLTNLRFLDGTEIKRSERIAASQRLSALSKELRDLVEARRSERRSEKSRRIDDDDAPTGHDPEIRAQMSRETHRQKCEKEETQRARYAPETKGEAEFEEEHQEAVRRARRREESGEILQRNEGRRKFWFDEESSPGNLVLNVAVPRFMSSALIDVDVHPTYASVLIKSKVLRVVLPVEVMAGESTACRSAATGHLQVVMPKANPNEISLSQKSTAGPGREGKTSKINAFSKPKKRERLGASLLREATHIHKFTATHGDGADYNKSQTTFSRELLTETSSSNGHVKIPGISCLNINRTNVDQTHDVDSDDEDGPPSLL